MKSLNSYLKTVLTVIAACVLWLCFITTLDHAAPSRAATTPRGDATANSQVLWSWTYADQSFRFVDVGQYVIVQRSNRDGTWDKIQTLGEIASAGVRSGSPHRSMKSPS